jgi:hypothetical protein
MIRVLGGLSCKRKSKGVFTLGARYSNVDSPNTMLARLKLKPSYHENFMLS